MKKLFAVSGSLLAGALAAQQPVNPVADVGRARAYQLYEARKFEDAAAQFQAYLAKEANDPRALLDYAALLTQLNRREEAVRQLELLHRNYPGHEVGYFRLGAAYAELGRATDAARVFTELGQSTNADMAAAAGEALRKAQQDQARATRVQAENRVFELARASRHADVVTAIGELEKQQTLSFALRLQRIYALSALHQQAEALAQAEQLAGAYPAAPDLALLRADLLAQAGRRPDAETLWRRIAERNPGTPEASEATRRLQERTVPAAEDRVYDLARQQKHSDVIAAIDELERLGPLSPAMAMQRIYSLDASGESRQALAKADALAAQQPDSTDLALLRADLLTRTGEWNRAARLLKQVEEQHPDTPAAHSAAARLRTLPSVANLDKWFWGEAYASGDYLGRYGTVVGSGFVRQGAFIPGARWLQPYAEYRFGVDTRSETGGRETVIADNALGVYGGARAQLLPGEYVFAYGQAGVNTDLLERRHRGDWAFDYQVGIYGFKAWGPGTGWQSPVADPQLKAEEAKGSTGWHWRGDWFIDAGANFSYYDRYRSWIGYAQIHEGLRLAQFKTKVAIDGYVLENVAWDVRGNFFDNFGSIGPGARVVWTPHARWQVVLGGHWVKGYYFGRDDRQTRGRAESQFDGVQVSLSVGARW